MILDECWTNIKSKFSLLATHVQRRLHHFMKFPDIQTRNISELRIIDYLLCLNQLQGSCTSKSILEDVPHHRTTSQVQ